jgi:hypothetical protein
MTGKAGGGDLQQTTNFNLHSPQQVNVTSYSGNPGTRNFILPLHISAQYTDSVRSIFNIAASIRAQQTRDNANPHRDGCGEEYRTGDDAG